MTLLQALGIPFHMPAGDSVLTDSRIWSLTISVLVSPVGRDSTVKKERKV
jgi:hypothetical protein